MKRMICVSNVKLAEQIRTESEKYALFSEQRAAFWGAMKMARLKDLQTRYFIKELQKLINKVNDEEIRSKLTELLNKRNEELNSEK